MAPMNLAKRADMWFGDGPSLATEVMGYAIDGLPSGVSACLRHYQHAGWKLLVSRGDERSVDHGYFATPDEAVAALEQLVSQPPPKTN